MTHGEEIALSAMKKELKSLSRRVASAKSKSDSCINAGSVIIKCRVEANEILKNEQSFDEQMKLIAVLADKEKAAIKMSKLNLVKLFDKETDLKISRDELQREINNIEYRHKIRNRSGAAQ